MSNPVAAEGAKLALKLLGLLFEVASEALKADDPEDALVKAKAAARMVAVKKTRGAVVRANR